MIRDLAKIVKEELEQNEDCRNSDATKKVEEHRINNEQEYIEFSMDKSI